MLLCADIIECPPILKYSFLEAVLRHETTPFAHVYSPERRKAIAWNVPQYLMFSSVAQVLSICIESLIKCITALVKRIRSDGIYDVAERNLLRILFVLLDAHIPLSIALDSMIEPVAKSLTLQYVISNNLLPENQKSWSPNIIPQPEDFPRFDLCVVRAWSRSENKMHSASCSILERALLQLFSKSGTQKCQIKCVVDTYKRIFKRAKDVYKETIHKQLLSIVRAVIQVLAGAKITGMLEEFPFAEKDVIFSDRVSIAQLTFDDAETMFFSEDDNKVPLSLMRSYMFMHMGTDSALYEAIKRASANNYDLRGTEQNVLYGATLMFGKGTTITCPPSAIPAAGVYIPKVKTCWEFMDSKIRYAHSSDIKQQITKWKDSFEEQRSEKLGRVRRETKRCEGALMIPYDILQLPAAPSVQDLVAIGFSEVEANVILFNQNPFTLLREPLSEATFKENVSIFTPQSCARLKLFLRQMCIKTQIYAVELDNTLLYEDATCFPYLDQRAACVSHVFPNTSVFLCTNCGVVGTVVEGYRRFNTSNDSFDSPSMNGKVVEKSFSIRLVFDPFTHKLHAICTQCGLREASVLSITGHVIYAKINVRDTHLSAITGCLDCGKLCVLLPENLVGITPVCSQCAQKRRDALIVHTQCYMGHFMRPCEVHCTFTAIDESGATRWYASCIFDYMADLRIADKTTHIDLLRCMKKYEINQIDIKAMEKKKVNLKHLCN